MPGGVEVVPAVVYKLVADATGFNAMVRGTGAMANWMKSTWVQSVQGMQTATNQFVTHAQQQFASLRSSMATRGNPQQNLTSWLYPPVTAGSGGNRAINNLTHWLYGGGGGGGSGVVGGGAGGGMGLPGFGMGGMGGMGNWIMGGFVGGVTSAVTRFALDEIRSLIRGIVDLTWEGARAAVRLGMEYEKSAVSFNVLTGSAEMGKKTLQDIYNLAISNPFTFRQLSHSAQMLLGLGVSADNDNMISVLSRLSDLATGDERKLQRLALAYGQVMAAGRLRGEELRQFTNVGVGIGDFSKAYGKSPAEFRADLEAGLVPASVVTKTLNQLTSIGGRFADMNAQVNKTVAGQWNQLTERAELFLAKLGAGFFEKFDVAGKIGGVSDMLMGLDTHVDSLLTKFEKFGLVQAIWSDIGALIKTVKDIINGMDTDGQNLLKTYQAIRGVVLEIARALALAGLYGAAALRYTVDLAYEGAKLTHDMSGWNPGVILRNELVGSTSAQRMTELAALKELKNTLPKIGDFQDARGNILGFFDKLNSNIATGNRELSEQEKTVNRLVGAYTYLGQKQVDLGHANLTESTMAGALGGGAGAAGLFRTNAGELAQVYEDFVTRISDQDTISAARQSARGAFAGVAVDLGMQVDLELKKAFSKERKLAPVKFELGSDALKTAIELNKHIATQGIAPIDRFQMQQALLREARFGPGNAVPNFNAGLGAMGGAAAIGANLTLQALSDKNFRIGSFEEFDKLRRSVAGLEPKGTPAMAVGSVEGQDTLNRTMDATHGIQMQMLHVLTLANTQRQQLITEIRQYNEAMGIDTGGY